jgi:SulP family sulfate permease
MRPRVAVLGRYKDGTLRDTEVYKDLPTDENIIAVRFDGSLYFANVSYFEDAMLKAVADNPSAKYLLVVGDAINQLDASGEEVLHHLVERLNASQTTIVFSGLKRQVLDVMRRTGLYDFIGEQNIFPTEDMALDAIYEWMGMDADGAVCPLKYTPQPA